MKRTSVSASRDGVRRRAMLRTGFGSCREVPGSVGRHQASRFPRIMVSRGWRVSGKAPGGHRPRRAFRSPAAAQAGGNRLELLLGHGRVRRQGEMHRPHVALMDHDVHRIGNRDSTICLSISSPLFMIQYLQLVGCRQPQGNPKETKRKSLDTARAQGTVPAGVSKSTTSDVPWRMTRELQSDTSLGCLGLYPA